MKHILKITFLLLAFLFPAIATAHDFEVDGIYYNINGNEATVTYQGNSGSQYLNEYSGEVTIPETVTYNGTSYPVTTIGASAFESCSGLTSVIIPNSVTYIGVDAFYNCYGLTSITIPNSITFIDDCAFCACFGLTSISIPNSVTSIGRDAFYDTPWYDNQPDGLIYAGLVAYKYKGTMPSGTNIILRESTLGIAGGAFQTCYGLTSITIPNSVTSIGSNAFEICTGLKSITIPNSVTLIGLNAFHDCI